MIPADAIRRARDNDIGLTATHLGAGLRKASPTERVGACPLCGGTDRFSINTKKQTWNCRGCGVGGGVIDLVRHIRSCSFPEAVAWLNGEIGNSALPIIREPVVRPATKDKDSAAFVKQRVADIVRELGPILGTSGERYLREIRAIDTDVVADVLGRNDAIGWHGSVLFREEGHPIDGKRLGAIVGVMTDPVTSAPTGAISRTYLHEGRKVGPAKTLGAPTGIVSLSDDADVLGGLHIAEGIETALEAMARGFRPIWSTGSAGLMASFPLLAGVECLTLFADHDASGTGLQAANEAAARWLEAGREAHVYQREIEGDLNDAFREGRG
jgi:putative DNA primase/helicase